MAASSICCGLPPHQLLARQTIATLSFSSPASRMARSSRRRSNAGLVLARQPLLEKAVMPEAQAIVPRGDDPARHLRHAEFRQGRQLALQLDYAA